MSSNGRRRFRVRYTKEFDDKVAARSPYVGRLDRVLEALRYTLNCNPRFRARNVVGNVWVMESARDVEAPLIWLYYTIDGKEVVVRDFVVVRDWGT